MVGTLCQGAGVQVDEYRPCRPVMVSFADAVNKSLGANGQSRCNVDLDRERLGDHVQPLTNVALGAGPKLLAVVEPRVE